MALGQNYLVEKRNILNEIRANGMSLQELRFFSIYLSKINARDVNTRTVRFALSDFMRIMEFSSHIKLDYLKSVTNKLLGKVVNVPSENGGYEGFQLFSKCKVDMDDDGEWYVEIDAHDQALPLMFQFKERYFTYELWNALRLKSSNQLRMYEILKQYERVGERVISVKELRELLGISPKEYPRYGDFKTHVLDVCQKALAENSDLSYEYEPTDKRGKAGKILYLKFVVTRNTEHRSPLSLEEFISDMGRSEEISDELAAALDESAVNDEESVFSQKFFPFLSAACGGEFSKAEMQVMYNLAMRVMPYRTKFGGVDPYLNKIYDYLKEKYDELNLRDERRDLGEVRSRFGYLRKLMEAEAERFSPPPKSGSFIFDPRNPYEDIIIDD